MRRPRGASADVAAWERTINGVCYWFDATPYDVKVFRLSREGGDMVHHWRDSPDVIGEYDRYDPSTRPIPGQVAWTRHWGPGNADRQYVTACRICGDIAQVTRYQLVGSHSPDHGVRACAGSGTAATLKAALVREAKLSPVEKRAYDITSRWLRSCKGFQTLSDGSTESCHHPVCCRNLSAGWRWTLSGWKKP